VPLLAPSIEVAQAATRKPWDLKYSTMASPIPLEPPVIKTTFCWEPMLEV